MALGLEAQLPLGIGLPLESVGSQNGYKFHSALLHVASPGRLPWSSASWCAAAAQDLMSASGCSRGTPPQTGMQCHAVVCQHT